MKSFDREIRGEKEIEHQEEYMQRQEESLQGRFDELLTVKYAWCTDTCEGTEIRKVKEEDMAK